MTRKIAAGCFAAAFGLAVSAGAQTPSPSTPQTPPSQPSSPSSPYPSAQSSMGSKETKLTGCVAAGTAANSFELTNVKKGASAGSESPSAPPAAGGAASSSSAPVKLVASAGADLATHVGHTVEVSGSWAKAGGADSPSAAPPAAGDPASSSKGGGKEFNVTAVKMVSSTCTAGTN